MPDPMPVEEFQYQLAVLTNAARDLDKRNEVDTAVRLTTAYRAALAEIERKHRVIQRYATHDRECAYNTERPPDDECDCGLAAALRGPRHPGGPVMSGEEITKGG